MLTNKQKKLNDFVIREAGLELDENNHVIDQYTGMPIIIKDKIVKYNNTNIARLNNNEIEFDPLNNPLLASEICNTYITNLQNEEELNVISYGISNRERNTAGKGVCISDEKIYTREYNLDTLKYIDLIATINNTPTDTKDSIVLKTYDAKQPAKPGKRRRKKIMANYNTLTDEQWSLVKDCYYWFYNENSLVFEYAGGPGTGKSFILDCIINYLGINREQIAPMAYTGAAAVNMRTKGLLNAGTIHSWIYHTSVTKKYDNNGNVIMDDYFNRPKETLDFIPKVQLKNIKLIIIDEAYMVPYEMKKDIEQFGIKIIACGDWNQLPPINSRPAYLTGDNVRLLTKVMRQAEDSFIVKLAYNTLHGIPISNGYYGDVLVINEEELTDQMIMSSDIVICSKNSTREYYNNKIRQLYGFTGKLPQWGERVICRSNNKNEIIDNINLANGLIGSVVNSPDVSGFDGKTFRLQFQPDLLDTPFDIRVSYKYFTAPYQQRDALKNDKFLEGEKFEFGYCITAHLSQGSQFDKVIVIDEPMMGNINNRLAYVAITRARKTINLRKEKI